jgi:mRNA interferase RelE/StbE
MLNPTELLADALGNELAAAYRRAFSGREPHHTEVIAEAAKLILERIGPHSERQGRPSGTTLK